jgi:AcrR family transcriptional regulator
MSTPLRKRPAVRGPKRPPDRREMVVAAAARLFHERGYRGTSIEDIGTAVGMTGPAVYRHFASKEAILAELVVRSFERAERDVAAAVAGAKTPRDGLAEIVRRTVVHAIEETDLVALAEREGRNLSPEMRRRIGRTQRVIFEAWIAALRAVRPRLGVEAARAAVRAVIALILAVRWADGVDRAAATAHFTRMAMAALLAE